MFKHDEKNRKLQIYKLKDLKRVNILIAEHEAECLKAERQISEKAEKL